METKSMKNQCRGSRKLGFSFSDYKTLVDEIRKSGYRIVPATKCEVDYPIAFFRHDVDVSVEKARMFSCLEESIGISTTYYFLVGSDSYNLSSLKCIEAVRDIRKRGHEIGLHLDSSMCRNEEQIINLFKVQLSILEDILGERISSVSWHIPQKEYLGKNIQWIDDENIINTYSEKFFKGFSYCSDSGMKWKTNPYSVIDIESRKKLQILTHPVWYGETGCKSEIIGKYMVSQTDCLCDSFEAILV